MPGYENYIPRDVAILRDDGGSASISSLTTFTEIKDNYVAGDVIFAISFREMLMVAIAGVDADIVGGMKIKMKKTAYIPDLSSVSNLLNYKWLDFKVLTGQNNSNTVYIPYIVQIYPSEGDEPMRVYIIKPFENSEASDMTTYSHSFAS